jgi:hypothetical protein
MAALPLLVNPIPLFYHQEKLDLVVSFKVGKIYKKQTIQSHFRAAR